LLTPAAILLGFVAAFGVNVPYWDQWDFVPLIRKLFEGNLTPREIWEPYAEQRLVIPRIVMLLLATGTRYNVVAEMYLSWLLLGATCALVFSTYRRYGARGPLSLLAFLPVPWLLFSPRQWDSLLWGWQVQRYLAMFFFVLGAYLLDAARQPGSRFGLAIGSATAASLCFSSGLLSWPIGLIQIIVSRRFGSQGDTRPTRAMATIWTVAAAIVVGLYLKDYRQPEHHPGLADVIRQPANAFGYALVALGNPLAVEMEKAVAFGSFLGMCYLAGLVLLARSGLSGRLELSFPFALLLFGVLDMGLLVIGRSGMGVEQALESRYTVELSLALVGLHLLLVLGGPSLRSGQALRPNRVRVLLTGLVAGVTTVGLATVFQPGMAEGYATYLLRSEDAYYVSTYSQHGNAAFVRIGPEPELVKRQARWLAQSRLSLFAGQPNPARTR